MHEKYTLPGLAGWHFEIDGTGSGMLWSPSFSGFSVNRHTPLSDIEAGVKNSTRNNMLVADEAAILAAGEAVFNIDWQMLLSPEFAQCVHDAPTFSGAAPPGPPVSFDLQQEKDALVRSITAQIVALGQK